MKSYQIRVNDREYQVEIVDMNVRPIRVMVDGETFEVWPGVERIVNSLTPSVPSVRSDLANRSTTEPTPRTNTPVEIGAPSESGVPSGSGRVIKSPLPGVVIAVHVQAGDEITAGQPVCVVEAMKMNNVIRASQDGKVAALRVAVGQHVKHHDVLVELV